MKLHNQHLPVLIEHDNVEYEWTLTFDYHSGCRGTRDDPPESAEVEFLTAQCEVRGDHVKVPFETLCERFAVTDATVRKWEDEAVEQAEEMDDAGDEE
jgi:hypothetical protein